MSKTKLPQYEDLFKVCTKLWADCVKARAGNKSELSGKTGVLNAHHLAGKPNYLLRFSLDNGMCLTNGEHFFIAHNEGRRASFEKRVKALRGDDIYRKLEDMRGFSSKTDLSMVKVYLTAKLKDFKNSEVDNVSNI